MSDLKPWNLVADIGGTHVRFAIHEISSEAINKTQQVVFKVNVNGFI
ncbi:MAG: hypothetical protein GY744_12125 [Gammaproteobacteria bacterium]|nr:hypothetical protein [Gammaproteobacteria bacterium]